MRYQDGSFKFTMIERSLARDGYALEFACRYGEDVPDDVGYTGRETGWEMRRKLKAWCALKGHGDFRILRNTSYHRDLHGPVYELWLRRQPSASPDRTAWGRQGSPS